MNKEMLLAAVNHEQEELKLLNPDWEVPVHFDMTSLIAIVGALQLAMRHPQFKKRPSAAVIRKIISTLITGIPEEMPATRELARLGDNPKLDI